MNLITKTISLPKVGKTRITFYRDKRRTTRDKSTFSLPFDVQLGEDTFLGEILYSPEMRSCRIMWSEYPEDKSFAEEVESFIKEFLFGTVLATTEPIEPEEAEEIMNSLTETIISSLRYSISGEGAIVIEIPIIGRESKMLKVIVRKKDSGDYFITDDGLILRSFRPHEKGQRDRVVFAAKRLGIELREEELYLDSPPEDMANNLYKFIQMISAVYLFYLF